MMTGSAAKYDYSAAKYDSQLQTSTIMTSFLSHHRYLYTPCYLRLFYALASGAGTSKQATSISLHLATEILQHKMSTRRVYAIYNQIYIYDIYIYMPDLMIFPIKAFNLSFKILTAN